MSLLRSDEWVVFRNAEPVARSEEPNRSGRLSMSGKPLTGVRDVKKND